MICGCCFFETLEQFIGLKLTYSKLRIVFSIFLIDHALTYEAENAEANLERYPTVLKRIAALVDVGVEEGVTVC